MTRVKDQYGFRVRAQYVVGTQRRSICVLDTLSLGLSPPNPATPEVSWEDSKVTLPRALLSAQRAG